MIRLGVTGTDTGVGKTVIACALVAVLRQRGLRVAAMKPVETGGAADADRLRAAAGGEDAPSDVCPVTFAEPLAPLVAAQRLGHPIDIAALDAAFARLSARRDAVVVEGAGGLLVPLTEQVSVRELFARWRLGLIVVAANRIGAINNALLTVHAARAAKLPVRALVLNSLTLERCDVAAETNGDTLAHLLRRIPVFTWPWLDDLSDQALVAQAERCGLAGLIDVPARRRTQLHRTGQTT